MDMDRRTGSCKVPVWSSVIMFLEFFSWIFCHRTPNCSLYIPTFVQCLLLVMHCQLFISHCLMIMSLTFRYTHIYSRYLNYKCNYLRILFHVFPTFRNQHKPPLYSHWKRRFHWLKDDWGEILINTTATQYSKQGRSSLLWTNLPESHIVKIYNWKILKIGRSDRKSEFRRNGSKIGRTPPKSEE